MAKQGKSPLPGMPEQRMRRFTEPIARFLHVQAAGGIVLLIATGVALFMANSPWSEEYLGFWKTKIGFQFGGGLPEPTVLLQALQSQERALPVPGLQEKESIEEVPLRFIHTGQQLRRPAGHGVACRHESGVRERWRKTQQPR